MGSSGVDVAIVGGGVIGCAGAYTLAREGLRVLLLERDRIGAHASGGAAGILSSRDDDPGTPFDRLNRASLALFPEYAQRLREETGIDVEYQQEGILTLLRPEEMETSVRFDARLLDRQEMLELEPSVGGSWAGAILHEQDGQVNAGRLTQALAEAAALHGAIISEASTVRGFVEEGDRVRGVRTTDGDVLAEQVVVAAGPWSGQLSRALRCELPVFPVKGEIVWARTRPRALRRPIFAGCYLVPKPELGIAIGATHVQAGFDETPTLGAAAELIGHALAAVPILREATLSRVWASVRPATPDGLPILGPVAGRPGLLMATGHYAYGIALSLITAELIKSWVMGTPEPVEPQAFRLERFVEGAARG